MTENIKKPKILNFFQKTNRSHLKLAKRILSTENISKMKVVLLDQMKNSAEKPKMVILQSRLLLRKSSEHLPPATTTTVLTTGPSDMSKLLKMR